MSAENPQQPQETLFGARFKLEEPVSDETYGVPEEVVPVVAATLLGTLGQMGISPSEVVFAGHDGRGNSDEEKLEAQKEQDQGTIEGIAHMMQEEYDAGTLTDAKRDANRARIAELRSGWASMKPVYDFGEADTLLKSAQSMNNPIHFAGAGSDACIEVYDKQLLAGIDPNFAPRDTTRGVLSVAATSEQLATARIAQFFPYYDAPEHW